MRNHRTARRPLAKAASSALIIALCILAGGSAFAQNIPQEFLDQIPQVTKDQIEFLVGKSAFITAEALGVKSLAGKSLAADPVGPPGSSGAGKLTDVGIGTTPRDENEPSAAANPKDTKKLVAGSHVISTPGNPVPGEVRCGAYRSSDNGATWTPAFLLPQLPGGGM